MNRILLIMALISVFSGILLADNSKVDAYSLMKYQQFKNMDSEQLTKESDGKLLSRDDDKYFVKSFIKADKYKLEQMIAEFGGEILYSINNIHGVKLPLAHLDKFISSNSVSKISFSKKMKLNNDKAAEGIEMKGVFTTSNGVILWGNDVVVGIVDTGIDIEHPDFKTENGTRIKYIWDLSDDSGNMPEGMWVGSEYSSEDIDNGTCTMRDLDGHGTHVAGTAAGNGRGNKLYKGIAPAADIISVKVSYDEESEDFADDVDILAGVNYIFKKAEEMQKPAVVNMSLGSTLGSHDGTDMFSEGLSELSTGGNIIVVSAGNDGELGIHSGVRYEEVGKYYETLILPVNVCEIFDGFCPDIPNFYATAGDMWYTSGSIDSIYINAYSLSFATGETELLVSKGYAIGDVTSNDVVVYDQEILGFIQLDLSATFIEENNSGNGFWMVHNGGDTDSPMPDLLWSVTIKTASEGTFDMWSGIPIPDEFGFSGSFGETIWGSNAMTIGNPADAKRVISVGSFITRNEWENDLGEVTETGAEIGALSTFSSRGPTRDGRIAPIISAPGEYLISAKSQYTSDEVIAEHYTPYAGTSMSAPVVTGTIAIILQLRPEIDFEELLNLFQVTSNVEDEFTGELPNNNFGYGKLNFNTIYGELVTLNVDNYINDQPNITLYPNPSDDYICVDGIDASWEYMLFDISGNLLKSGTYTQNISIEELPSGSYFLNLRNSKQAYAIPFSKVK